MLIRERAVRSAALLFAVFTVIIGTEGIVSPDSLTTVRRLYFATPVGLYAAGALRVGMGLVLILAASSSRGPRTLRALGAIVCLQGIAAAVFGVDRAQVILEREAQHTALLRAGAAIAAGLNTKSSPGNWELRARCVEQIDLP
jgi:hypothetical protein